MSVDEARDEEVSGSFGSPLFDILIVDAKLAGYRTETITRPFNCYYLAMLVDHKSRIVTNAQLTKFWSIDESAVVQSGHLQSEWRTFSVSTVSLFVLLLSESASNAIGWCRRRRSPHQAQCFYFFQKVRTEEVHCIQLLEQAIIKDAFLKSG